MPLTRQQRATKLQKLAELLGFKTVDEMFDAAVTDTVCPGICVNPGATTRPRWLPINERATAENDGTQHGAELPWSSRG